MGFLKVFAIALLAVVLVLVLVGGYLGLVPGVSGLFGSDRPRDLGATYTQADYQAARAKMGMTVSDLPADAPPEQSISITNINNVNISLTQSEVNALVNISEWKYYPLRDVQVNIQPDNVVEFSGIIIKDRIEGCALALGASKSDMRAVMGFIRYVPANPTIYFKGTITIIENRVTVLDVSELRVGRMPFLIRFRQSKDTLVKIIESWLAPRTVFTIRTFRFSSGQLQYEGSLPDIARSR